MGRHLDYLRKKYAPMQDKTLQNALAHRIGREFPRVGGPRIRDLCATMILEVVREHLRPREHVAHGQVLWMAVSVDDPPRRHQRIADTDLIPVILDLSTSEDIERRLERMSPRQRLLQKAIRLCRQAHGQGALLSNCDLAELLSYNDSGIASVLAEHERQTQELVPRRATVHDVGTGLTHKRIICHKRYAEGKPPDQVARETYHSLEAVDRYLGQYDRVRHCRQEGLTPQETAHVLDCTLSLVQEYLAIDQELGGPHA
jgi:DNA-binding CsgD family transcriptional regulator